MEEKKKIIKIVGVSPGDVERDRKSIKDVTESLNKGILGQQGFHFEFIDWNNSSFPRFHVDGPQGVIDEDLDIKDSEIVIGLFHKRYGSPTRFFSSSGTEHEIRTAYSSWLEKEKPQIFLYFKKVGFYPNNIEEIEQIKQVFILKGIFQYKALLGDYKTKLDLHRKLRENIEHYMISKETTADITEKIQKEKQESIIYQYTSVITVSSERKSNLKIPSSVIKEKEGSILIWCKIYDDLLRNEPNTYILSLCDNNGRRVISTSKKGPRNYLNSLYIRRTAKSEKNPDGDWTFGHSDEFGKVRRINSKLDLDNGWHVFTVCWSKIENFIQFYIDDNLIETTPFSHWPKYSGNKIFIGSWPSELKYFFFNTDIGPIYCYKIPLTLSNIKLSIEKNSLKN